MDCQTNGLPTPCSILCNDIIYNAVDANFTTTSSGAVYVPGSSLIIPANGSWTVHYSIEIRGLLPDTNTIAARMINMSLGTWANMIETYQSTVGSDDFVLHGGINYQPWGSATEVRWQIWRFTGTGTVECRRARICAIKRCA